MSKNAFPIQEPALYAQFKALSSTEARANLPVLIDHVCDSGKPVIIRKLGTGRAALIPARDLTMHTLMIQTLGMTDPALAHTPIEEIIRVLHKHSVQFGPK